MNKIFKILTLSLILLTGAVQGGTAQNAVGSWKTYNIFAGVDKILDTPSKVYYVSVGQLYSYDKEYEETYNYSTSGKLHGSMVSNIYYDYDRDNLIVVYSNANIDIIDEEGGVYNLPDIKDATLDVVPVIRDVDFSEGKIYVATNFGIVVFDSVKKEVVTSGNWGKNITSLMVEGENLWIVNTNEYYKLDKNAKLGGVNLAKLPIYGYIHSIELIPLSSTKAVTIVQGSKALVLVELGADKITYKVVAEDESIKNLRATKDGAMCHSYSKIYKFDNDGNLNITPITSTELAAVKVGNSYEEKQLHSWKGFNELWMGSDAGISSYKLSDGNVTVLSEAGLPESGLTFNNVGRLYTGPSGAVYAQSYGYSEILKDRVNKKGDMTARFHINKIVGDEITAIDPVKYTNKKNPSYDTAPIGFKSGYEVREIPNDPETIILGTIYDGFWAIKDREQIAAYDNTTSTIEEFVRYQASGMDFDRNGNLWVVNLCVSSPKRNLNFLKADKVGKETTPADWQGRFLGRYCEHDGKLLACKHSNTLIYKDQKYSYPLLVVKTQGTDDISDDVTILGDESNVLDQDGLTFSFQYTFALVEDHKGRVWLGTNNGIIEITNPEQITENNFRINHLKVPRRDGTNFADYLLAGESVTDIAVDPSNRKWATTIDSGVYLISEDGDEILEHFDMTNSPLTSNDIYSVTCGPDNYVYFGNPKGLYRYSSTSAPAAQDFSNVYAYPNPVRPEYSGWITITGLMDNSLVKIADAAGNVFYQGESEGGMMLWDGCDRQGRRVKTGVYYVFASQGGEGQSTAGAVTKILVVN